MNIVLIGYRGTGKSVVGRIVAEKIGWACVGMDAEIVDRAGASIPEIVEKEGWSGFRDREARLALELAGRDNMVVDCGGGVIERPENMKALRARAVVFWLRASVKVIIKRIEGGAGRPALVEGKTFTEEIAEVLERRTPLYRASSHHEIDTDSLTPVEIADRIINLLPS